MSDGSSQSENAKPSYERSNLETIASRWNARAKTWDAQLQNSDCHLNEDDAYRRFLDACHQVIKKQAEFCAHQGVIEAGCGTGLVLQEIVSAFAWGVGVDISEEMLEVARRRGLHQTRFILGDCFALPQLCDKAGAVLSRGVLLSHYGPEQGLTLLRAAHSTLVPGGFMLFDFLNQESRDRYVHTAKNKTYLTGHEVCCLAREAGFSSAEILGEPERRVRLLFAT